MRRKKQKGREREEGMRVWERGNEGVRERGEGMRV